MWGEHCSLIGFEDRLVCPVPYDGGNERLVDMSLFHCFGRYVPQLPGNIQSARVEWAGWCRQSILEVGVVIA
jgi:hypothetical protein